MKTVLITGASRGIGKETAIQFSKVGWHVVINYNKSEAEALKLAKNIGGVAVCADISKSAEVDKMYETLNSQGIHIDCIVNNAGIASDCLFTDITEADWDEMFLVNVKGTFLVTKKFLPDMIAKKNGNIINVASIWGEVGASGEVHYSSAKSAIIGMTKALAKELAPSNIRVNCVCPGFIKTDMTSGYTEEDISAIIDEIPLQRLGTPKDVAGVIEFLASPLADYMTGQIIGINGGWNI